MWIKTALMQACRSGHWEVVQTLMLFRCNVSNLIKSIFIFLLFSFSPFDICCSLKHVVNGFDHSNLNIFDDCRNDVFVTLVLKIS